MERKLVNYKDVEEDVVKYFADFKKKYSQKE